MVGLGETFDEIVTVMRDLAGVGVDILTLGQYLQPSKNLPAIERYYEPDEFVELKRIGLEELGFKWVESGPLVRSSYRAAEQVRELSKLNLSTSARPETGTPPQPGLGYREDPGCGIYRVGNTSPRQAKLAQSVTPSRLNSRQAYAVGYRKHNHRAI